MVLCPNEAGGCISAKLLLPADEARKTSKDSSIHTSGQSKCSGLQLAQPPQMCLAKAEFVSMQSVEMLPAHAPDDLNIIDFPRIVPCQVRWNYLTFSLSFSPFTSRLHVMKRRGLPSTWPT